MRKFEIPKVRAGRDLFRSGSSSWHDAILDVYDPSWTVYVEGYRLAADHLLDLALSEGSKRDFVIYPILFLYRQYLELALKELVVYGQELSDEKVVRRRDHHRLQDLWAEFDRLMTKVSDRSVDEHVAVIRNTVRQFASLDPTSYLFRYPENKDGTPVRYPLERVDLETLQAEMRNASSAIEIVSGGLSALVDQRREFMSEMGP